MKIRLFWLSLQLRLIQFLLVSPFAFTRGYFLDWLILICI
nr:MAG TPA: hypothetical protein [Caudoviricetes sp.]